MVGIPQGCPLSMMFIVAFVSCLGVVTWLHRRGSSLGCMLIFSSVYSRDPGVAMACCSCLLLVMFGPVGQELAPNKCVLLSTSWEVRRDMKDWVLSDSGDKWSVKFDVRDLGGHLDTTFRVGVGFCWMSMAPCSSFFFSC